MTLNPVAVSKPLENGSKEPTNYSNNFKANLKACAKVTLCNSSDYYNPGHAQPTHNSKFRQETNKASSYSRVDQPSDDRDLTAIRAVNELFADEIDYRDYIFIEKSARYDDEVANELKKMTKKSALHMKDRTFSG